MRNCHLERIRFSPLRPQTARPTCTVPGTWLKDIGDAHKRPEQHTGVPLTGRQGWDAQHSAGSTCARKIYNRWLTQ